MKGIKCDFTGEWFEYEDLGDEVYNIIFGNVSYNSDGFLPEFQGELHICKEELPDYIIDVLDDIDGTGLLAMTNTAFKSYSTKEEKSYFVPVSEDLKILHLIGHGTVSFNSSKGEEKHGNSIPIDVNHNDEVMKFVDKLEKVGEEFVSDKFGNSYNTVVEEASDFEEYFPLDKKEKKMNRKYKKDQDKRLHERVESDNKQIVATNNNRTTELILINQDKKWVLVLAIKGNNDKEVYDEDELDKAKKEFVSYVNKYELSIVEGRDLAKELGIIEEKEDNDRSFI
jgi:hypothetical protein